MTKFMSLFKQKERVEMGLQILLYTAFYTICFSILEKGAHIHYHTIEIWPDSHIPLLPIFIIPYFMWFGYIFAAVFWLLFYTKSTRECQICISSLVIGMTIFLLISAAYPNKLALRPHIFGTDIFSKMVAFLYKTDTPTNVFPSIHVFNTAVVCASVIKSAKKKRAKALNLLLSASIVLSTVFLKQHSILDVAAGLLMAAGLRGGMEKVFGKEEEKEEGAFQTDGSFGILEMRQK